jgi:Lysozyme like domain/Putative peptidoglycan binding domain
MATGRHRKKNVVRRRGSTVLAAGVMTASASAAMLSGVSPASAASSSVVSDAQIAAYAQSAGLAGCDGVPLSTWVAIALAESGGNTYAHATGIEDSRGLWQINLWAHGSWVGNRNLYDPTTNAWAATQVCKGSGPDAWSTYTNGWYRSYLARGYAAANAVSHGGVVAAPVSLVKALPTPPPTAWYLSQAANHGVHLDAVNQLQTKLSGLGFSLAIDGYFGPRTDSALRAYQANHGLSADGVVGAVTHRALFG